MMGRKRVPKTGEEPQPTKELRPITPGDPVYFITDGKEPGTYVIRYGRVIRIAFGRDIPTSFEVSTMDDLGSFHVDARRICHSADANMVRRLIDDVLSPNALVDLLMRKRS